MKCKAQNCIKHAKNASYCWAHYYRLRRYGSLQLSKPVLPDWQNIPLEKRFWMRVKKTSTCWNWTGNKFYTGYGHFWDNTDILAHRFSYELLVGPIPKGLTIDHQCGNKLCVNPSHLKPMTLRENILKSTGPAGLNLRKTHCSHGHPYNEENTEIRKNGARRCRICNRKESFEYQRKRRKKLKELGFSTH